MHPIFILLVVVTIAALLLCYGLSFSLRRLGGGWKSYLRWEAVPAMQLVLLIVGPCCLNWSYEAKLFHPRHANVFTDAFLGPILFAVAVACMAGACALLFVLRLLGPRLFGPEAKGAFWIPAVMLGLGISFLTLACDSLIILGPAALTLRDQMDSVPP